ncbi:glycosyltransferase [Methylobacterium oryzae]|uniref:Glycosyltransferase 2-like domain-containing protein n=1 Tax=Methylobacterium oryzae TaxID=334852 RepID=A0ABU7TTS6_9HYPH
MNEKSDIQEDYISGCSFWKPEYTPPSSAWIGHAPFAFWLIDKLRPDCFVELGVHLGYSYFAFCQAIRRLGLTTRAYAVDHWHGDDHAGFYDESVFESVKQQNRTYAGFSTLLRKNFDGALSDIENGSVDLLHIDGRHAYEDVRHDFETWRPKLSQRAVVLFHDTAVREQGFGVHQLFEELQHRHSTFEFTHSHGLGVLFPNDEIPAGLRSLTGIDRARKDFIRNVYACLGNRIETDNGIRNVDSASERSGESVGAPTGETLRAGSRAKRESLNDEWDRGTQNPNRGAATDPRLVHVGVVRGRDLRIARLQDENARLIQEIGRFVESHQSLIATIAKPAVAAASPPPDAYDTIVARLSSDLRARDAHISDLHSIIDRIRSMPWFRFTSGDLRAAMRASEASRPDLSSRLRDAETAWVVDRIAASGLFDPTYYAEVYHLTFTDPNEAILDFDRVGWRAGRDPSATFRTGYYLYRYPDVRAAGTNPLIHYIEHGRNEGRPCRPTDAYNDRWRAVFATEEAFWNFDQNVELIKNSLLFDTNFYAANNPDVVPTGVDLAWHYAVWGGREGRDPSAFFSSAAYLLINPDVEASGINPLLHYIKTGRHEGRSTVSVSTDNPNDNNLSKTELDLREICRDIEETGLFDRKYYRDQNPDVEQSGIDPVKHFAQIGWKDGRQPNRYFDMVEYNWLNPDVAQANVIPIVHFAATGIFEDRQLRGPRSSEPMVADYAEWYRLFDTLNADDLRSIRARIERLRYRPLISIAMPVYNTAEQHLREAIASIQKQVYQNWELCIVDDASTDLRIWAVLTEISLLDKRIKISRRQQNGHIVAATNAALDLATGDFVAFVDHDDVLPAHALFEIASCLNDDPRLDLIYTDEDHINDNGERSFPHFKTDFNLPLLLSMNYVNHLCVIRRTLIETVGRLRPGYEGSQDYDLVLRVMHAVEPSRVRHIPKILYHWRMAAGADTFSQTYKDRCSAAARRAIGDFLEARGLHGSVGPHPFVPDWHRVTFALPEPQPLVSVIVPTKDKADLLEACVGSVLEQTFYKNFELIIVDHESGEPETFQAFNRLLADSRVRIVPFSGPFNYSKMNNFAADSANGSLLLFLNNDVSVIDGGWMGEMVSLAVQPDVGAVGAKLLYPDGRVQHGGVLCGVGGVAGHLAHLLDSAAPGYMGRAVLTSRVSAVTGACLMLRKTIFETVGRFDEEDLKVAFNDVDLCLKVDQLGYSNLFAAQVVLYHHESASRGSDQTPKNIDRFRREIRFMVEKWGDRLASDPFYNANFNPRRADFALAWPPRRPDTWTVSDIVI